MGMLLLTMHALLEAPLGDDVPPSTTVANTHPSHTAAGARARLLQCMLFLPIALPYGIFQGFLQTPLPFLLRKQGFAVGEIASLLSLLMLPNMLYFLWSPVLDVGLRKRTWLLLASTLSGIGLLAAILIGRASPRATVAILLAGCVINTLTSGCQGGLLAGSSGIKGKLRASGWLQVGNYGGVAMGGGLLLLLAERLPVRTSAIAAALLVTLPSLAAFLLRKDRFQEPHSAERRLPQMWREIRTTLFSRKTAPSLLVMLAPVGTGAASALLAGMAKDYGVGAGRVIWVNGFAGGLLTIVGCMIASAFPVSWDRRLTYVFAGCLNGLAASVLWLGPARPGVYIIGTALYLFTAGLCYTSFTMLVVDTMGRAGISAASRFTLLDSMANAPTIFLTWLEGRSYHAFGPHGVPALDALANFAVGCVVLLVWMTSRSRGGSTAGAEIAASS